MSSDPLGPVEIEFTIPDDFGKQADSAIRKMAGLTDAATDMPKKVKAAIVEQKSIIKGIEQDIASLEKSLKTGLSGQAKQEVVAEANAAKKALAEEKASLSDLEKQFDSAKESNRRLTYQFRDMTDQLAKMRVAGLQGTDEYRQLEARASKLSEQMQQTRQVVKNRSDDQRAVKGLADGVTGLAGAFSAGIGIVGLFAGENENLAKIQAKVQSIIAVTVGLQQVANTLDKESAFMSVTVAKAKQTWAAAEKTLTAALWGSNVAAKALMITLTGGLALVLPTIIALVDRANKKQKEALAAQQEAVRINKEASKEAGKSRVELEMTISKLASFKGTKEAEKRLIEETNKKYGESFGKYKTLSAWLDVLKKKSADYVQVMFIQAKAQSLINDALKFQDKATDLKMRPDSSFITGDMVARHTGTITGEVDTAAVAAEAKKRKDQEIAVAESWYNARIEQAKTAQKELMKIEMQSGINTFFDEKDAATKAEQKSYADRLASIKNFYDLYEQAVQLGQSQVAEVFKQQMPQAGESFADYLAAEIEKATKSGDIAKLSVLIPEQADVHKSLNDLLNEFKTYDEQRADLEKKYNDKIAFYNAKGFKEKAKLAQDERDKLLKELDDSQPLAKLKAQYQDYDDQIKEIQTRYQAEIERLKTAGYAKEAAMAEAAMKKEIDAVEETKLKSSAVWSAMFEDMGSITATELQQIIDTAKANMEALADTLSAEDIKAINDQIAKLQGRVDKMLSSKRKKGDNPFLDLADSVKKYSVSLEGSDEKQEAFSDALAAANSIAEQLQDTIAGLINNLVELGIISEDSANSTVATLTNIQKFYQSGAQLAAGIATLNPTAIISGISGMFDSVVKVFSFKANKIAKKQAEITKEIAAMERAYAKLQRAIETAIGTEVYDKQREAIKANQEEIKKYQKLIDLEEDKKKKKRNQEDIEAWKNEIAQLEIANEELYQSIVDTMTQTNVKDLSNDLMENIVSAAQAGQDAFLALGDTIDQVLLNAVKNAFKLKYIEPFVDAWIEELYNAINSDDNLTPEEVTRLKEELQAKMEALSKVWGVMSGSFGFDETTGSDTSGGFASMDQSTGNQMLGQFTALRISTAGVNDILQAEESARKIMRASIESININVKRAADVLQIIDKRIAGMESDGIKLR